MIISRTPFRISFLGGGTDLPSFYQEEEGAVLSTSIDKYMYITVNTRFDESYRLSYSETEIAKSVDQIRHRIFRSVLEKYEARARKKSEGRGLEIVSMADIPAGSGLGSSSSFTVGLLNALKGHLGQSQTAEELASEASHIEIEELHEPIGKQDQYAAAFGGLNYIRFLPSGQVSVEPVITSPQTKSALEASMLLFYTGTTRSASKVLSEQKANTEKKREELRAMRELAKRSKILLEKNDAISKMGEILDEGWNIKKSLASGISDHKIDDWYQGARKAGAWGGKVVGAGGGGFLLMLADPSQHSKIKSELKTLREVNIKFEPFGSRIIFVG